MSKKERARFRSNYVKSKGCWEWIGSTNGFRGMFYTGKRHYLAPRLSWMLAKNKVIPEGLFACHKCDNPMCVRPGHIFIGTRSENMLDCARKGRLWQQTQPWKVARGLKSGAYTHPERRPSGERHGMAKLTLIQASEIKNSSLKIAQLAEQYGIGKTVVSDIKTGKLWRTALATYESALK